ncbi:restriction endonuclease subunit S [Microbacterium schleiferi]|uniref:restriction endonuclease subunit S n=1 Tax=Microbacterium schleiferi TaxID=69362 RepID=UPI0035C87370
MGETSEKISALGLANSAAELLPAGTVALSRTASVGFAGIMPVAMATSQDFWNWVPGGELVSEYLWFQFQAMKPEFERLMTGSTHRTIYQADAASFTIIVPPISEQREIVEQLDNVTRRIDEAIATAQSGVALARERRAALISAAVTGKIDVGVAV